MHALLYEELLLLLNMEMLLIPQESFYFNDNCDPNDIIPYGFILLEPDSTRFFTIMVLQLYVQFQRRMNLRLKYMTR